MSGGARFCLSRADFIGRAFGLGRAVVLVFLLPAVLGLAENKAGQVVEAQSAANGAASILEPKFAIEFTNVNLQPSHWKLEFDSTGAGQFDAEAGLPVPSNAKELAIVDVHHPFQLSNEFAAKVFATARNRRYFQFPCESHMKVAFQGTKKLTYAGPDGSGSCEFNYSKDKEIQALGDSLMALETTLLYGARLEKMLQHDRLGLDQELENLVSAAHEGTAVELGAISDTLSKIAGDDQVLERARRKARLLLAQTRTGTDSRAGQ